MFVNIPTEVGATEAEEIGAVVGKHTVQPLSAVPAYIRCQVIVKPAAHQTDCGISAGVEHLLRDVKDSSIGTAAAEVEQINTGLQGLKVRCNVRWCLLVAENHWVAAPTMTDY